MTAYYPDKILSNLETAIRQEDLIQPLPMSGDQWLLSSAMQKSIRRSAEGIALRAAISFWHTDRLGFLRRLHILAVEDIGMANPALVIDVLAATSNHVWRRQVGDLRTALYLVRKLCQSVKTRLADELLLSAERSSTHDTLRLHFSNASDALLVDYIIDENCTLIERALAAWYLAGTQKFTTDLMPQRKGSLELATEVLRSLSAPAELVESCIAVMGRTQWPLALFTPLIWQELQKHKTSITVKQNTIATVPDIEGLPLYAACLYTRTGQSCYRQLQKLVPELQEYSIRQIGVAQFYIEGGLLDRVITSPFLESFSNDGEVADAEGTGLPLQDYLILRDCMQDYAPLLEVIRREQLQKYFNGMAA